MLGAVGSLPSTTGRRILAIRTGALGDTLLALPSISALRTLVGTSGSVDFVGSEPAVRLARGPRHATAVHSADRAMFGALHHELAGDGDLARFLGCFDLVVAWARLPLLRDKLTSLGIPSIEADPFPSVGVHASDHLYRSLLPLGISGPAPPPELEPDAKDRAAALDFLEREGLR
ncbi:MAG: glycosyltransferase family 9 protein, partial [Vicinamibacteria bacterium]